MQHHGFMYYLACFGIVILSIFILVLFLERILRPLLRKVWRPITAVDFNPTTGKYSISWGFGNRVMVAELPDFDEELKGYYRADQVYPGKYKVEVGPYPDSYTSGPAVFQTMVCPNASSAYITARIIKHVYSKQINNDGIYYRITKV